MDGLEGNLCRCTGYINIVKAVMMSARLLRGKGRQPRLLQQASELASLCRLE